MCRILIAGFMMLYSWLFRISPLISFSFLFLFLSCRLFRLVHLYVKTRFSQRRRAGAVAPGGRCSTDLGGPSLGFVELMIETMMHSYNTTVSVHDPGISCVGIWIIEADVVDAVVRILAMPHAEIISATTSLVSSPRSSRATCKVVVPAWLLLKGLASSMAVIMAISTVVSRWGVDFACFASVTLRPFNSVMLLSSTWVRDRVTKSRPHGVTRASRSRVAISKILRSEVSRGKLNDVASADAGPVMDAEGIVMMEPAGASVGAACFERYSYTLSAPHFHEVTT